jgi:hypothetical protein
MTVYWRYTKCVRIYKNTQGFTGMRTLCLAYSTPQRWLPQRFRTCPHTKSTPTLLSDVSDPEVGAKKNQRGPTVRSVGSSRIGRNLDELSLRRGSRWVRCSVVRREMLTGRKWVEQSVAPSVCIERRIVGIVGRVASSQSCGVFVGEEVRQTARIGSGCVRPKKEGVAFLFPSPNAEDLSGILS